MKRLDPELPFYYYTSAHHRFYEGTQPNFSIAPRKKKRSRLPQRELLGSSQRVTVAVRGSKSLRTTFHNVPVDLPPPPTAANLSLAEHSYSIQP